MVNARCKVRRARRVREMDRLIARLRELYMRGDVAVVGRTERAREIIEALIA